MIFVMFFASFLELLILPKPVGSIWSYRDQTLTPASGCTAHRSDRFSLRKTKGISPSMLASQCRGVISLVEKEMFQDLLSAQELGPNTRSHLLY